jgi:hypothetical protein
MFLDDEMMTAVIKIQCLYRTKIARGDIVVKKAAVLKAAKETKWYACDDGEGNIYYYNTDTEECVWWKPDDFDGEDKTPPVILNAMMKKAFEGKLKKLDPETHKALKKAKEAQAKAEAARDMGVNEGKEHWVECYDPGELCISLFRFEHSLPNGCYVFAMHSLLI